MKIKTLAYRPWFKWIVLIAACSTQTFCAGYMNSTMNFFTIHYADRFNDRKIAGIVGSLQGSILCLGALPAFYIVRRIGERYSQLIGGFLIIIGVGSTAYATAGWHALLANGVVTGVGTALALASPYSIIAKYFPGKQLVPYAAMSVSYTVGILAFPQIVGFLMRSIGYTNCLLACCSFLFVNFLAGFVFLPINAAETGSDDLSEPKWILKIKSHRRGIYQVSQADIGQLIKESSNQSENNNFDEEVSVKEKLVENGKIETSSEYSSGSSNISEDAQKEDLRDERMEYSTMSNSITSKKALLNSQISYSNFAERIAKMEEDNKVYNDTTEKVDAKDNKDASLSPKQNLKLTKSKSIKAHITDMYGKSIGKLADDRHIAEMSFKKVIKRPQVIIYTISAFFLQSSYFSFAAVIGDYARHRIQITDEQFGWGMTIIGIAMLPTGLFYLLLTRCSSFSATFLHAVNNVIVSAVMLLLLSNPTVGGFYALMAVYGMCRSFYIGNLLPTCMEISSPKEAILTYMVELVADGLGGLTIPYLTTYLHVEVDMKYGLLLAGCLMAVSSLMFIPIGIKHLLMPKTYSGLDSHAFHYGGNQPPPANKSSEKENSNDTANKCALGDSEKEKELAQVQLLGKKILN